MEDDETRVMSTLIEIDSSLRPVVAEDARGSDATTIERLDSTVTYNDFFAKHLTLNKPCVVDPRATEDWPCRRDWVLDGAPGFEALRMSFGRWRGVKGGFRRI